MKPYKLWMCVSCFFVIFQVAAQVKNEKETRVSQSDFPKAAIELLVTLPKSHKKIKYYRETDSLKVSYEAKVKLNRRLYSIEFDNNGLLEDIEVLIKKKHLDKALLTTISKYLSSNYLKFSIIKIQKQYVHTPSKSISQTLQSALDLKNDCNYEIITEVKQGKQYQIKELTFDAQGKFLSERTLKPSSYEHILY